MSQIVSLEGKVSDIPGAIRGELEFTYDSVREIPRKACIRAILAACCNLRHANYDYGETCELLLDMFFGKGQVGEQDILPGDIPGEGIEDEMSYINAFKKFVEDSKYTQHGSRAPRLSLYTQQLAVGVYFYVKALCESDPDFVAFKETISATEHELAVWIEEECDAYKKGLRTNEDMERLEGAMHLEENPQALLEFRQKYDRKD